MGGIDGEKPLDVDLCQLQLKEYYLQDLCKIPQYPGDTESCLDMNEIYTNLSILYDKAKPCGPICIPLSSESCDLPPHHQIFTYEVNGMLPNRILILGRGGSGKTTLLAKIAFDWATKMSNSPLLDTPLLFVINMRCVELDANLEDAIVHQLLPSDTEITATQLHKYMKAHAADFVVLLDSYDEFSQRDKLHDPQAGSIIQSLANNVFTSTRVLVTTRHWRASEFASNQRMYAKFEITGFSQDNLNRYIMKTFDCYQDGPKNINDQSAGRFLETGKYRLGQSQEGRRLCDYIAANNLYSIASFPLMAQLLCLLWNESGGKCLPSKIGDLYDEIFQMLYKQYASKNATACMIGWKEMATRIGEVACLGLWPPENNLALPYKDITQIISAESVEDAFRLGIVSIEKPPRGGVKSRGKYIVFFHKTGQEKCAGEFIAHLANADQDTFNKHLTKLTTARHCLSVQMILRFVCGVCKVTAGLILQHLMMIITSTLKDEMVDFYEDTLDNVDKAKVVQELIEMCLLCNYECNAAGQFNTILSGLFPLQKLQFLGVTPYTSAAIGYFLANISETATISTIKIVQLPQPGVIPSGNSGVLESVYKTAKTTFKDTSKREIKELYQQYVEAHKNDASFDRFTSIVKSDFSYGMACIQQWDHFKTWNSSTNIYLDPILDSVKSTNVQELDLTDVKLSDRGQKLVETITQGHLYSLTRLKLKDTGLAPNHMCAVVKALPQKTPNLKLLDMAGNDASEGQIVYDLTKSLTLLSLQSLNIRGMNAPADDMCTMAYKLPTFAQELHILRMRGNKMNDSAGKTLTDTLPHACYLEQLEMTLTNISKAVHKKLIVSVGHLKQLLDLRLFHSQHPDDLVLYMSRNPLPDLTRLVLGAQYELKQTRLQKLRAVIKKSEQVDIRQTVDSSAWQKLLLTLETKSPKLKKLELYNISLQRSDMEGLMGLCRRTGLAFG